MPLFNRKPSASPSLGSEGKGGGMASILNKLGGGSPNRRRGISNAGSDDPPGAQETETEILCVAPTLTPLLF